MTSSKANPLSALRTGNRASKAISSRRRVVVRWKRKNSSAAISRGPPGLRPARAVEQHQNQRHFRRTVGMAQAADHGAAIANRHVGDVRMVSLMSGLAAAPADRAQFAMAGHRLDDGLPPSMAIPLSPSTCWISTSSEGVATRKFIAGNKALAASQHHRVGVAGEDGDSVPQGPRRLIPKQRRLHATRGPSHNACIRDPNTISR